MFQQPVMIDSCFKLLNALCILSPGINEAWNHKAAVHVFPGALMADGNYVITQCVEVRAFIPWPIGMKVAGCWKITQFPTPLFSTDKFD